MISSQNNKGGLGKKSLETISIEVLYGIIHILKLEINLYLLILDGKVVMVVQDLFCVDVFQQLYNLDDFCIMKIMYFAILLLHVSPLGKKMTFYFNKLEPLSPKYSLC